MSTDELYSVLSTKKFNAETALTKIYLRLNALCEFQEKIWNQIQANMEDTDDETGEDADSSDSRRKKIRRGNDNSHKHP